MARLISIRHTMELIGLRRTAFWALRRRGDFVDEYPIAGTTKFREIDVERWIAARNRGTPKRRPGK